MSTTSNKFPLLCIVAIFALFMYSKSLYDEISDRLVQVEHSQEKMRLQLDAASQLLIAHMDIHDINSRSRSFPFKELDSSRSLIVPEYD